MEIVPAGSPRDVALIGELFTEYARAIEVDLCFQNFQQELAALPGQYAPPEGRLLLAFHDGNAAGCVALRKQQDGICEMKRLYVRPTFRRQGTGRKLAQAIIEEARSAGYERMRLDTLASMKEAIALYQTLGFKEIGPYYHNPHSHALFMELGLT